MQGVVILLTVSVAVDMSLGVGLPEDAVTPGRHVGTHLDGVGSGWGIQIGESESPLTDSPAPAPTPVGFCLCQT